MDFTLNSVYDQAAVTAMARALRKTVRKKHSRRSHVFGWIVTALALMLSFLPGEDGFAITFKTVATWLVVLVIVVTLLFEDAINGYFARQRALPGTVQTKTTFASDGYYSVNDAGETLWSYKNVQTVAETGDYLVFVLNKNHAQVYDMRTISGGTEAKFREFLMEVTGKPVQHV
jgi:hypothetical protein